MLSIRFQTAAVLFTALAISGCGPAGPPVPESSAPGFTSLFQLLKESGFRSDPTERTPVWHHGDDYRAVYAQHPPGRVEVGPLSGSGCVLRFALGIHQGVWGLGDGVRFKVSLRRHDSSASDSTAEDNAAVDNAAVEVLFSELFSPQAGVESYWADRELAIPDDVTEFSLIFETHPGPRGDRRRDQSGWGSPYLTCETPTVAVPKPERPHVFLISLDTLRRDRLGLYGYDGATSPTLDALAAESIVFDNCFSQASYTTPAHASMFTGLYPEQHGAGHRFTEATLSENAMTVAEILKAAGYRTLAVTAGGMVSGKFGFSQGFDEWNERQRAGLRSVLPEIFDAWRRNRDAPVFFFLHTYDIHGPYREPSNGSTPAAESQPQHRKSEDLRQLLKVPQLSYQKLFRFDDVEEISAAYDAGIRSVDAQLAELFGYLREIGVYDNSLIIITSDHGESLYDRGIYFGHGFTLHDEEVHVPLLIRLPGGREKGRRAEFVEHVDLLPLILDETGIDSDLELPGRNPLTDSDPDSRPMVRGETSHTGSRYVRSENWKVIAPTNRAWERKQKRFKGIVDRFETGWQVYHLTEDDDESENLFGREERFPPEVRRLIQVLRESGEPGLASGETTELDEELAGALRALGYID